MTLNQLRAFLSAAESGSFTGAARHLGISQASASELIRRMETEFGVVLFVRRGRGVVLTAAGIEFRPWAERSVAAADAGRQAVSAVRSLTGGTATFGLFRNARFYLLSELLVEFHQRYPDVTVRVVGQNSAEVAAAVASGSLEAGLVVLPVDEIGLEVTPLMRDEMLYASASPTRVQRPVTMAQLANAPLILYDAHYGWRDPTRRQLAERAHLMGHKLVPLIEVEYLDEALSLVARGVGDTMMCRAAVTNGLCPAGVATVPFEEPIYDTIALIKKESSVPSPATAELVRMAEEMLRDSQKRQPTLLHWLGDE